MINLDKKRIAVTGGRGFLGSHIVDILKARKLDIDIPQKSEYDFRKKGDCTRFFKKVNPQVVINCAAFQGGIGFHSGKQADLFMDNIQIGCFLMQTAQESGVEKFINVVAGCAYPGYLEKEVMDETDFWSGEIHDSIFSYGFSRKATVVYGKALYRQYGFNSIHLVLANMYGPRDHYDPKQSKALAALIRKIYEAKKNGKDEVEIWGTGKPLRDWLYVKDGAEGIIKATEVYESIDPLNIASGRGVSVTELAKAIKSTVGYTGRFVYNIEKPDGAMKKIFGTEKMKRELNWSPQMSIELGIKESVQWFIKNYEEVTKK